MVSIVASYATITVYHKIAPLLLLLTALILFTIARGQDLAVEPVKINLQWSLKVLRKTSSHEKSTFYIKITAALVALQEILLLYKWEKK